MICPRCKDRDHLACKTPSCTCGHDPSPVRALTATERHDYMLGRLHAHVIPREADRES